MSRTSFTPPDWKVIDTVLFDMDGTLLDLKYDNDFWLEAIPARYAELNGLALDAAKAQLKPLFVARQGTLDWYCIDFWSRELKLDVKALKHATREAMRWLPEAEQTVLALRRAGKRVALVTNAHTETLAVKDAQLNLRGHFDAVYSSHSFGYPKEQAPFWPALSQVERFDPRRTLFVDDSLPVLRAARDYGISWIYAIAQPDSSRQRPAIEEFPAVDGVEDLVRALRP